MELNNPITAYVAEGNLEAHALVDWLMSNGVDAYAVEDNSGVSLWAFGTISQFHKPKVWIDKSDTDKAKDLLIQFEDRKRARRSQMDGSPPITATCAECGQASEFPVSQNGSTQNCPKCYAFMDVGSFDWPDDFDFGDAEPEPQPLDNADDAIDAASKLDKIGDWQAAIAAYRGVADRWPEHATYVANCIVEVQRKIDATR